MFDFEVSFYRDGVTVSVPVVVDDDMLVDFAMFVMDDDILKFCSNKKTVTTVRQV